MIKEILWQLSWYRGDLCIFILHYNNQIVQKHGDILSYIMAKLSGRTSLSERTLTVAKCFEYGQPLQSILAATG